MEAKEGNTWQMWRVMLHCYERKAEKDFLLVHGTFVPRNMEVFEHK